MNPLRAIAPLLLLPALPAFAQEAPATITIHADNPIKQVSPTLYGLMTEEINYSYDGGLYAELVRNRTFHEEDLGAPAHWFLVQKGDAQASMVVDRTTGPSAALHQSLAIKIKHADPTSPAGTLNEGYWGMAMQPNTVYQGSFYAKADNSSMGPVTVSLVNDGTGLTLASTTVSGLDTTWHQHTFSLKTGALKPSTDSHLALTVGHEGTLWLNLVSLFPPTYHGRVNGNRVDLMEKLAEMKPTFLRLPGGNYLEGDEVWQRYEFKTTIGPLVDRPTHPSPWGYQSSDGMGLLEFLEWCEDLNIQPVLAVYAGYSMRQQHIDPGPTLEPYVADALDEIDYVTGDATTTWGARRVKDGHPAPFPLKYVEIGNEDFFDRSKSYDGRYAQFYKAIKAKYPQLQLIATDKVGSMQPDIIDDHYYKRAEDMMDFVHHYDEADRHGPKIFVGEWATREGSPTSNFGAALADAAWMTGMERNSDLIILASYAPLLVNVNPRGMQWESNLIGYDAMSSYGSPSYYAQSMFAKALGTEVPENSATSLPDRLFYSVTEDRARHMLALKLVNASSVPRTLQIDITGAGTGGELSLTTLSAPDTTSTNTISAPRNIVPATARPKHIASHFTHVVPAYSIQVLSIETKQ